MGEVTFASGTGTCSVQDYLKNGKQRMWLVMTLYEGTRKAEEAKILALECKIQRAHI